jgi:hypothetical protein
MISIINTHFESGPQRRIEAPQDVLVRQRQNSHALRLSEYKEIFIEAIIQGWLNDLPQFGEEISKIRDLVKKVSPRTDRIEDFHIYSDEQLQADIKELAALVLSEINRHHIFCEKDIIENLDKVTTENFNAYETRQVVDIAQSIATLADDYNLCIKNGLRFPTWSSDGGIAIDSLLPICTSSGFIQKAPVKISLPGGVAPVLFVGGNSVGKTTLLQWLCLGHSGGISGVPFPGNITVPQSCALGVFGGGSKGYLLRLRVALQGLSKVGGGVLYCDEPMLPQAETEMLQKWLLEECLRNNIKLVMNSNHPWSLIHDLEQAEGAVVEIFVQGDGTRGFRQGREIQFTPERAAEDAITAAQAVLPPEVCARAREILRNWSAFDLTLRCER